MHNSWADPEKAASFLTRAANIPFRGEGERVLVGDLDGMLPGRILELGCGDARLTGLLIDAYPGSTAVCADFSDTMLQAAANRFAGNPDVTVTRHDLEDELAFEGAFDAVVSSLAIHHVSDERKQSLLAEVVQLLAPRGVLANLDIVASPSRALHDRWREEMGAPEDPSDFLRDLESQLRWFRDAGLDDVDCIWKWRGLALMRGQAPG